MVDTDRAFAGSIPALYDRYLGPLFFSPYAEDLAARIAELSPGAVLETAAGTGIVTAALARRLPEGTRLTATDLNPAMIDIARSKAAHRAIDFRPADATALPFVDQSFDLVACQFGAMFFPDKLKGYREAYRVLKPGGSFLFNVWDRIEQNHVGETADLAVADLFPADPPHFLRRTPHGYFDAKAIAATLAEAGFRDIAAVTVAKRSRAPSPREPAIGICQGTPLRNEIVARDPDKLEAATDAAEAALARRFGPGPVDAPMQAIVFRATR